MTGKIVQVMGSVVDINFTDYLPEIEEFLEADLVVCETSKKIRLTVVANLGNNYIRAIAIDKGEGLMRGQVIRAMQYPEEEFNKLSTVRKNLLTKRGYSPYCGSDSCENMPRTAFNGSQFVCSSCSWESTFPLEFIDKYKHFIKIKGT